MTGNHKDIATRFLRLAASGHAEEAASKDTAPGFRHHNPFFAGDGPSLFAAMDRNARDNPGKRLDIQRVIGEGDLVAVHSRVTHGPDDRGFGTVHIFRFEGERIAELWDLAQAVPEDSPNANGMF